MLTALLVIGILILLIVVHEFGHFVAAKIFGVRVDEFGVGYPPRALLLGKIGETEYTVNWIPFGGFVKLFGEEEEHGARSFADAPRWKQAIILVAGVFMNALAALVLFTGAYSIGILHQVPEPGPDIRLMVSDVVPGSPASAAGLAVGDYVVALKDAKGVVLGELTPQSVSDFVSDRGGKDLTLIYVHADATTTATLTPAHAVIDGEAGRPAIGLGLALVTTESLPLGKSFSMAWHRTTATFAIVWDGLSTIVKDTLRGEPDLRQVVGPVGLVGAVGQASTAGWGYVLSLAAFISVNLTIINLIPIPALDGGRLFIVGIESVLRRSAPRLAVQTLNALGIGLVIILMVVVTYQDIARLFA